MAAIKAVPAARSFFDRVDERAHPASKFRAVASAPD
jgi:hypothetical protein